MNTTAFITRSLKNAALEAVARFFLGLCLALALAPLPSAAAITDITQLRVERADDGVYLSALVQFELAAVVEDALLKGIPPVRTPYEDPVLPSRGEGTSVPAAGKPRPSQGPGPIISPEPQPGH